MLKAIFLAKLAYSECYPEVMVMHMNISTVYEAQRKYTDAIMSLFLALNISIRVYGQTHLHTAIIFSALASLHYDIPDIEQTIKFQQRSISILEELLGSCDERVVEAKNTCEGYKNIQNSKKIREVHEKEQRSLYGLPSLGKFNMKTPFYDMRERGTADFFWKKSRRLKYFF
jgi:tetratricopeptide (TPR) repeat protein